MQEVRVGVQGCVKVTVDAVFDRVRVQVGDVVGSDSDLDVCLLC